MRLTAKELNRLTIFTLAELARRRKARGRKLNAPEAIAIICDEILEMAWDGLPLAEVIAGAQAILTNDDVMDGVPEIIGNIEIDALFPSGTTLVVVEYPFGSRPRTDGAVPGGVIYGTQAVSINVGRPTVTITVENLSEKPIEITSHYHFFEANRRLRFDRRAALGMRLDIAAGTSVRWEPHQRKLVHLLPVEGKREIWGFGGLVDGPLDPVTAGDLLNEAISRGYAHEEQSDAQ